MRLSKLPLLPGLLVLVLTFAFATWGFGHRFVSAADAAAATYAAVYGLDAGDLCGDPGEDHAGNGCDACHLLGGFHLPRHGAGFARLAPAPYTVSFTRLHGLLPPRARDAARPARAPPLA